MSGENPPATAVTPDATVTLREITSETLHPILRLQVADHQKNFVAPNSVSIAEAYFEPVAWFRGIYADETPVGFVMVYDNAEKPEYVLWRFMIDQRYQRMGFGGRALQQVMEYVRTRPGAKTLLTSYVPGDDNAGPFYESLGFVHTGEEDDGELVMKVEL